MNILVVGSGGREHAICWALSKSPLVKRIFCVPGNGGTANEAKCVNIDPETIDIPVGMTDMGRYAQIAAAQRCNLAVIGPEDPLAAGIADAIEAKGIPVAGPRSQGALLEASKDRAKQFMQRHGVACASSRTFDSIADAHAYIDRHGAPIVVKADGLAAGKGVVVARTPEEARRAAERFLTGNTPKAAGRKIVLEDYLQGSEISILAAVSVTPELTARGKSCIKPFIAARDHKRLEDGARGPNTGGMGAVSPLPDMTDGQFKAFEAQILQPTLRGMEAEQIDYRGFIFFGLMLTAAGPKLLEYNVRLGDPETQAVLPLMDSDFAQLCKATAEGTLADFELRWKEGFVCAPVAVSGGYPDSYAKGMKITVDRSAYDTQNVQIFIAGASSRDKTLVTSGGRVFAAAAYGDTSRQARERAYEAMQAVQFDGMFYRRDIGMPGAADSL